MIKILQSKWTTLVLLAAVGWLGISAWDIRIQREATDQQVRNLEAKIEGIEQENLALEEQISYLANSEYLARLARLKLNVKLPDEVVTYVYPKDEKPASQSSEVGGPGMLEKIKNWWYDTVR